MFPQLCFFFFFNDTAPTEIYTLSLHDALPIFGRRDALEIEAESDRGAAPGDLVVHLPRPGDRADRKSTRLNSSHLGISYAVFCLKKKKKHTDTCQQTKQYGGTHRIPFWNDTAR